MDISNCSLHREYVVEEIHTSQQDMQEFLFTLGCYPGEKIQLISKIGTIYILNIKNSRYSIDQDLAEAICLADPYESTYSHSIYDVV